MSAIPKSLHTVTAVVRVAKHFHDRDRESGEVVSTGYYVVVALELLGYEPGSYDPHGLYAKSLAALKKELGQ